jgi:hypothetical protein
VLELTQRLTELPRAEVTEGTDDVAPDVDHEGTAHRSIVPQGERSGRMGR